MGKDKKPQKPERGGKKAGKAAGECRCKEAAQKTPAELMKMALADLGLKKKGGKK
ncbi:MAG: hypothetical protein M0Z52_05185 [Actinomycetota bacterium]|nr:hypothetical protein [Actinomycetota bacterium]